MGLDLRLTRDVGLVLLLVALDLPRSAAQSL